MADAKHDQSDYDDCRGGDHNNKDEDHDDGDDENINHTVNDGSDRTPSASLPVRRGRRPRRRGAWAQTHIHQQDDVDDTG